MNEDKISCYLQVSEYGCDSQDISTLLGIEPTETFKKGDVKRRDERGIHPDVLYETNFWILESELPDTATEEEHLEAMLMRLEAKEEAIKDLATKYEVEIEVYGTRYHPHLGIFIEKAVSKKIASLGIGLGLSIYTLTPSYLDSQDNVAKLASMLEGIKDFSKAQSTDNGREPTLTAEALATFEDLSEWVNTGISDLTDESLSGKERMETLANIKGRLQTIIRSIEKSRYLSS
jgi:hypothetical protein